MSFNASKKILYLFQQDAGDVNLSNRVGLFIPLEHSDPLKRLNRSRPMSLR